VLDVLNAKDRIPYISRRGNWLYNLWQDEAHKRGLWRRTTLAEYRKAEPAWETVIDLDALGKAEGENWVWGGASCHGPDYRRCLVSLSRGGADAKVVREFDVVAKTFVKDGFVLPEAKSSVDWIDANTVYVSTDFGPGSMTDSGYPRIVKRWKRGTPLSEAVTMFEAQKDRRVGRRVARAPRRATSACCSCARRLLSPQDLHPAGDKLVPLDVPTTPRRTSCAMRSCSACAATSR
jgi:prolyl oligopeptidase